jgi:hypothetical protein
MKINSVKGKENAKCFIFIIWLSCGLETLADAALGLIAPASTLKDRIFWLGSDERQTCKLSRVRQSK